MKIERILLCAFLCMSAALPVFAVDWKGLEDGNWYSGPKLKPSDLAGKLVLVEKWGVNCPPCRASLPHMEELWKKYRARGFVLIGAHCQGRAEDKVKELVTANKLTYPMYGGSAGIAKDEPSFRGIPFCYIVSPTGKILYSGSPDGSKMMPILEKAVRELGAPTKLFGSVELKKYASLKSKLVLGKSIDSVVRNLERDKDGKKADLAEEAKAILEAIAEAKLATEAEIERLQGEDEKKAAALIKLYSKTWPKDAEKYKAEKK